MSTATSQPAHGHNWATLGFCVPPAQPAQFEIMVRRLGLENQPDRWPRSQVLRHFAEEKYKRRYVPEWLLVTFGLIEGDDEPPPKPVKPEKALPFHHSTTKSQAHRDHIGAASRAYWERKKAAA